MILKLWYVLVYLIEVFGSIIFLWPINAMEWCAAIRHQTGWRKIILYMGTLCGIASELSLIAAVTMFISSHGLTSLTLLYLFILGMGFYIIGFLMHMGPMDYFTEQLKPKNYEPDEILIKLRWKHSPFRRKQLAV